MRLRSLAAAVLAAGLALPIVHAGVASAQADDWEVSRDPFDKTVIARYKAILARNPHDAGALAKLLSMYRRYRTVDLLIAEYDKQLEKKPDDFATLVVLARLRASNGDAAGAQGFWERAAKARPDDAGVQLELAELQRNAGHAAEARAAYEHALTATSSKPIKMKALRALADLALAAGDVEGARTYFEQYIALDPKNVQLRLELGDALAQANRPQDAVAVYRDAEKRLGSDPARRVEVVARIGQALESAGDDDGAIKEYRRAIKLVPRGYYIEVELTARVVDIYRRKQDLPALLAMYEAEWPAAGRGHFEWDTLARLYEETGNQEQAIAAYKKAVAKAPYELETQRRLIQLLENVGRDDEALKQYEVVVGVAPGEARFQLELAERYQRRGNIKKALEVLRKLEGRFPSDAGVQAAIADLYTRWDKEDLALAAYERLARLEPDEPSHLVTLGEQYYQRGDKTRAIATWKRIANAKTAAAYAKLGEVLAEHDMPTDALANYARAIKLDGKNPELYKGRASVYERTKAYAEAVADWERVLSLLGDKAADRVTRREARRRIVGVLTRWAGKEAEYRNRWVRDFRKTPADVEAGYFLVELYQRRPQAGEPRATLEKLRKLKPEDQDITQDLVKVYKASRLYDDAVALLLELLKASPGREREIYTQIAEIKTEARQDDEAIAYARKALDQSPNDPVAYERLAERYVEMQRIDDAIAAYEKTIQLDPRNFKAFFALAERYKQSDRNDKAAALYREILRKASDEEILGRAGRAAIDLEEMTDSLGELEKVLAPLSFVLAHKPVYRRLLVELYMRYVQRLVDRTRHGAPEVRQAARGELVRLGRSGLKPLLEALSDDKDVAQQRVAVQVLGHLGNHGAAAPLVHLARQEPVADVSGARRIGTLVPSLDWDVRVEALVAAGRLADAGVIDQVLPLARHQEVAMREAAVYTLGRTGDKRAVPALIAALGDSRDSVQVLACLGLGQIDDGKGVEAMAAVVADVDRHDLTRASCAWGLGRRKAASAVPQLLIALGDGRGEAQRLAAWALGQIGERRAVAPLVRAYFDRGRDRQTVAWALARLGGNAPAIVEADLGEYPTRGGKLHPGNLLRLLPGEIDDVIGSPDLVVGHEREIVDGLHDSLSQHRDMIVRVLADLDARDLSLGLGTLVPAKADAKVEAALATIGRDIAPDVAAQLGHRDPKVRALAISVSAKLDGAGIDRAITAALGDEAVMVRQAAMRALVTLARKRGQAPLPLRAALAKILADGPWADRIHAAEAMGQLGSGADVEALIAALADTSPYVREQAADALGGLRSRAAVDRLLALTDDDLASTRRHAAAALVAIADPKARARLAELAASDPDPSVRAAAGAGSKP